MKRITKLLSCLILIIQVQFINAQSPVIQWQKTIGGSDYDDAYIINKTFDGGSFVAGISFSPVSGDKNQNTWGGYDYWIVKLDSVGNIQWQNTIGGSSWDILADASQTADSGFILGGSSYSGISGNKTENNCSSAIENYWIVKLDKTGNIQWQKTIGGDDRDILASAFQTTDGGYFAAGYSNSDSSCDKTSYNNGSYDLWVLKLDSGGNIQWQKTIAGSSDDYLSYARQTLDKGYILASYSDSDSSGNKTQNTHGDWDYWIIKLDNVGNIQWQNTIGGDDEDQPREIHQTKDKGYILAGYSDSDISGNKTQDTVGGYDVWVLKLDSMGNIQWQNDLGGTGTDYDGTVVQATDGNYYLGAYSNSPISGNKTENTNGGIDMWLLKLDTLGNIKWQNSIGGSGDDYLLGISETHGGGLYLTGSSESNISGDKTDNSKGVFDYWVVKLCAEKSNIDTTITTSGSILTSNQTNAFYQWYLNGNSISGATNQSYTVTQNGTYYVEVRIGSGCNFISDSVTIQSTAINRTELNSVVNVYPNPSIGITNLQINNTENGAYEISITNVIGELVYDVKKNKTQQIENETIDLSGIAKGSYQIAVTIAGKTISGKLIIQ